MLSKFISTSIRSPSQSSGLFPPANGLHLSILNFDATSSQYFDRGSKYADIDLKFNEAESQIQLANGRGGVFWVIAGSNAANIIRQTKGFMPAPVVAPIGAHIIGYLRDGTVPVVKTLSVISANDFIVGYKGYMAGDAAIILAEWIPIYFTPVWQAPILQNQQGLMSMYDLFINNAKYADTSNLTVIIFNAPLKDWCDDCLRIVPMDRQEAR